MHLIKDQLEEDGRRKTNTSSNNMSNELITKPKNKFVASNVSSPFRPVGEVTYHQAKRAYFWLVVIYTKPLQLQKRVVVLINKASCILQEGGDHNATTRFRIKKSLRLLQKSKKDLRKKRVGLNKKMYLKIINDDPIKQKRKSIKNKKNGR